MMTPPSLAMLKAMLSLQHAMNRKINDEWLNAGYPFLRAVLVEAVEALDHYGWKWWKRNTSNEKQLRIELIDIWHFLLSEYLVRNLGDIDRASSEIMEDWLGKSTLSFDEHEYDCDSLEIRERLELLAAMAAVRRVSLPLVATLMDSCGISVTQLFREYVSKNILNHFRQDHGYRTGEYRKLWDGQEDNVHLASILDSFDSAEETLPAALYDALKERYARYMAEQKLE